MTTVSCSFHTILHRIDYFISEDQTNLRRHARHNAQEAIALAKQRAEQFDTQAALERKTNEALHLAKAQAHLRDDDDETGTPTAPLMDRKQSSVSACVVCLIPR